MNYHRKVIRIRAEDSPNVRLAFAQKEQSISPTDEVLVPGVLTYGEYVTRRATWDAVRQCIGLDGEFYQGPEELLFPPVWLNEVAELARSLPRPRRGIALGVDTAEGGDDSAWAVVDEAGLIDLLSYKTPDTTKVAGQTLALMQQYNIEPYSVLFDQGGGGQWAADQLRKQGYKVGTVSFGESASEQQHPFFKSLTFDEQQSRPRYSYKNRRAQMYHRLHQRLHPQASPRFAIPGEYEELRRQLAPMPLKYDEEGRVVMLPKRVKENSNLGSLIALLGRSPDQADALVLAVHALQPVHRELVLEPMF